MPQVVLANPTDKPLGLEFVDAGTFLELRVCGHGDVLLRVDRLTGKFYRMKDVDPDHGFPLDEDGRVVME